MKILRSKTSRVDQGRHIEQVPPEARVIEVDDLHPLPSRNRFSGTRFAWMSDGQVFAPPLDYYDARYAGFVPYTAEKSTFSAAHNIVDFAKRNGV
jgi:hypothetical protein